MKLSFIINEKNHPDIYVHCDDKQKMTGQLYIHREGRGGIDITFGDKDFYGGILIKGVKYKDKFIKGQKKFLDFLIDMFNIPLPNKSKYYFLQSYFDNMKVSLNKKISENDYNILISSRIGLEGNREKDLNYLYLLYRFIREDYFKEEDKVDKKTEVRAIYYLLNNNYIDNEKVPSEISKINDKEVDKYVWLNKNINIFKENLKKDNS